MAATDTMELIVTHRGTIYRLSLPLESTLTYFYSRLEELTSIPADHQKLIYKGKKATAKEDDTLTQAGLKSGLKVQMIGPTAQELGEMRSAEDEKKKRDTILRERAAKPQTKLRSTASPSQSSDFKFRFHRIEPLPHLPNPSTALDVLNRLANDAAIRNVMQKHQFSIGLLTELAPHEHPNLLGLNTNAGQVIQLRIRTNAYDGFRPYKDIRRVLCHELTHNVWGDHDNNFKELNSQLNREVLEYERSVSQGTYHLSDGTYDIYEPSSELEAEAREQLWSGGTHVLGGSIAGPRASDESREERRRRVLEATMSRSRKEEEELEQSCGTAGPSAGS